MFCQTPSTSSSVMECTTVPLHVGCPHSLRPEHRLHVSAPVRDTAPEQANQVVVALQDDADLRGPTPPAPHAVTPALGRRGDPLAVPALTDHGEGPAGAPAAPTADRDPRDQRDREPRARRRPPAR